MKLSNQAIGAMMLALQKGILDQSDITGLLREFEFYQTDEAELGVENPPSFEINAEKDDA
tara:strand:- start:10 stop:189 length:180 start_codon:yes stop_codon:yes gene_type:complete